MKRSLEKESDSDEDDIFHYKNKMKLTFHPNLDMTNESISSDSSSSSDDEEEEENVVETMEGRRIVENSVSLSDDDCVIDDNDENSPPPNEEHCPKKNNAVQRLLDTLRQETNFSPVGNTSSLSINETKMENVKIRLHGYIQKYEIQTDAPFHEIFEQISKAEDVAMSRVSLTLRRNVTDDRSILPSDTVQRLSISITDIIECFIHIDDAGEIVTKNTITLQLQFSDSKHREQLTVDCGESLKKAFESYCEENNKKLVDILIRFDGEVVDLARTPEELDMDDNDMLDVNYIS